MNKTEENKIELAVLIGLNAASFRNDEGSDEETLKELKALLETAGGECVGMMIQNRPTPDAKTFIGEGKTQELAQMAKENDATLVVFDNELSPSQIRVLSEITGCTVIDRSGLILDIFAKRAKTNEGKLQVELAQYKYILPRLSGLGASLSRQGGGIGTRGPGESKLESDRRHIRRRIEKLEEELDEVRRVRSEQRRRRKKSEVPMVSLVGYTNAGKSTLLNALTSAGIPANDRLFDTLDTTTRQLQVTDTLGVLLSDTVGFIRKLPHHLIRAFKATLEELAFADVLLHVVDCANPEWKIHMETVEKVIKDVGAEEIPVITVYNKIDKCEIEDVSCLPGSVMISAKQGQGIDALLSEIERHIGATLHKLVIELPYDQGHFLEQIHADGQVLELEYTEKGTKIKVICDEKLYGRIACFEIEAHD